MKIQDPAREHPPFDIAAGQWPMYRSQGYHQLNEPDPTPPIEARWHVSRGRMIGDYEAPPYIVCNTGGNTTVIESQNGSAHRTAKIRTTDGRTHTCPEHISRQYEELFAAWASKSKKKKAPATPQVSASTPPIRGRGPWGGELVFQSNVKI